MCGRYFETEADQIAPRFHVEDWEEAELKPNFNVAPRHVMPVITMDTEGRRHIEMMRWGIPRVLGKDFVRELINTRSDKAFGGFWKKTVTTQRCLIPATGFYEWKKTADGKIPYIIHPKDEKHFAFAGIWSTWKDDDGQEIKTYSIMTTEPNKEMSQLHDREPVMLHRDNEALWLETPSDDVNSIERLLYPYEDNGLEIYEVSRDVNSVKNNYPELLLPVTQ